MDRSLQKLMWMKWRVSIVTFDCLQVEHSCW